MKHVLVAAVALCLLGCGGEDNSGGGGVSPTLPDFTGVYSGNLHQSGSCSDGSPVSADFAATWNITQSGAQLDLSTNGSCGMLTGTISGHTATLDAKKCTDITNGNVVIAPGVGTGSTVTLSGSSLSVHMNFPEGVATTSGASGNCNSLVTGTLSK